MADITIADFWGCEKKKEYRELDDNAGTSAVIINNQHGLSFFEKTEKRIKCVPAQIEDMIPDNPALLRPQVMTDVDRASFFRDLDVDLIEDVVPRYVSIFGSHGKATNGAKARKLLRVLIKGWRLSQGKLMTFAQFIKLNFFCSNVRTDLLNDGLIYPTPYSIIELHDGSMIELHGPLIVGYKKIRKSKKETRLLLEKNAKMTVNEDSYFGYGSDVEVFAGAHFSMGHCAATYNCTIICGKRIEMQGRVSIGRDVCIRDTNAHLIAVEGYKILRPVIIENHVWICSGASISPGVKIKAGAVVGANSYVIQNVPSHTLVSGSPAKVVMSNISWKL
jgi:acetyltransferase-like isoleucine patch superfamily enzyme